MIGMKQYMNELIAVLKEYKQLGISEQIDYQKFYLYSIITHSTAIEALNKSREDETMIPFQEFMLQEHAKNLRGEIAEYQKSINEEFEVVQKGGPETKKVVQKSGPENRSAILQLISENERITSREMANKLNINRSAILKHLKKMQEENIIHREGSQKSGRWVIISKS